MSGNSRAHGTSARVAAGLCGLWPLLQRPLIPYALCVSVAFCGLRGLCGIRSLRWIYTYIYIYPLTLFVWGLKLG